MPKTLLKPTGSYLVGHVDIEFTHPNEHVSTTILARVFYPSKLVANPLSNDTHAIESNFDTWIPSLAYFGGYGKHYGLPTFVSIPAMRLLVGDLRLNSTYGLPVLPDENPLPVVVYSHGLYGNRTTYSIVCCEFASRGWCVFSLEHHDGSASHSVVRGVPLPYVNWDKHKQNEFDMRNKQLETRTAECLGVVDLARKLNSGAETFEANLLNGLESHREKNRHIAKEFFKVFCVFFLLLVFS